MYILAYTNTNPNPNPSLTLTLCAIVDVAPAAGHYLNYDAKMYNSSLPKNDADVILIICVEVSLGLCGYCRSKLNYGGRVPSLLTLFGHFHFMLSYIFIFVHHIGRINKLMNKKHRQTYANTYTYYLN